MWYDILFFLTVKFLLSFTVIPRIKCNIELKSTLVLVSPTWIGCSSGGPRTLLGTKPSSPLLFLTFHHCFDLSSSCGSTQRRNQAAGWNGRERNGKKSCWLISILTSTISPFLTVSSRSFLERKSAVTLMGFGCDSPKLKNTSQGDQKPVRIQIFTVHWIILYVLVHTVIFWGSGVVLAGLKSTKKKCKVLLRLFFFLLCILPVRLLWWMFWDGGWPGWVQVADSAVCSQLLWVQVADSAVCSQLLWVQVVRVLQTPQGAASHQRTPECTSGCPHRLRATGCW